MMLTGFLYAGIADLSGQFTWLAIAFTFVIHIIALVYSYLLKLVNGYLLDSEKDVVNRHTGIVSLLKNGSTDEKSNDHKYVHYSGIYGILMLNFFLYAITYLTSFKDIHIDRTKYDSDEEYRNKVKLYNGIKGALIFFNVLLFLMAIPYLITWFKNIKYFATSTLGTKLFIP